MSYAQTALVGIVWVITTVIAATIDFAFFGALAAIPLAALAYLGVISIGTATAIMVGVGVLFVVRVVIVSAAEAVMT